MARDRRLSKHVWCVLLVFGVVAALGGGLSWAARVRERTVTHLASEFLTELAAKRYSVAAEYFGTDIGENPTRQRREMADDIAVSEAAGLAAHRRWSIVGVLPSGPALLASADCWVVVRFRADSSEAGAVRGLYVFKSGATWVLDPGQDLLAGRPGGGR